MSNPKIIQNLLAENNMLECNSKSTPYIVNADLSARRMDEEQADIKDFQKAVGTLRFIADTTHPAISWIAGVLGRHLHNPAPRYATALKSIYRFLSTRRNHGPRYDKKGPLELTCYTDSDYAADRDTRRSLTGLLVLAMKQPIVWASARQETVTHSSTEAEYIAADTGA